MKLLQRYRPQKTWVLRIELEVRTWARVKWSLEVETTSRVGTSVFFFESPLEMVPMTLLLSHEHHLTLPQARRLHPIRISSDDFASEFDKS